MTESILKNLQVFNSTEAIPLLTAGQLKQNRKRSKMKQGAATPRLTACLAQILILRKSPKDCTPSLTYKLEQMFGHQARKLGRPYNPPGTIPDKINERSSRGKRAKIASHLLAHPFNNVYTHRYRPNADSRF